MDKDSIYKKYAKYYDLIYDSKDYESEAKEVAELIEKYQKSDGKALLDVACGTGKHLQYLKKKYDCLGVDLNKEMLEIARKNVIGVKFMKADMTTLNLGQQFDVIVSLFSAIGHVKTKANLKKTIKGFVDHLKPGGVVIIEPWVSKGAYREGQDVHLITYESEQVKIARMNISKRKGDLAVMDMHYLVGEKGKEVVHFIDHIELAMVESDEFIEIMKQAGLKAKYLKRGLKIGRGVYIGVRQ